MFDRQSDRERRGAPLLRQVLCLALLASFTWTSCAGPMPTRGKRPTYEPPTAVSGSITFAPSLLDPEVEADHLASARGAPALMRRAWLELLLRRPESALDTAAEVLYGPDRPSAHEEAFARYLRAEAFRLQGFAERGAYDLERARTLALDPELQRRLRPEPLPPAVAGVPWGHLAVEPRDGWAGQSAARRNLDPMTRPTRVTIHHSAMYFRDTRPRACAAQIARIQKEHMQNRGYGDIGYHFLIDPSGRVWEGRELRWQGAHASGDNNVGNIGICLLGNFVRQRSGQGPTEAQVRAMEQLVVQLMQHYRFGPDALFCHSDFKPTECPGPRMTPIVKQLARELRARGAYLARAED